jgi:hypothetical protein
MLKENVPYRLGSSYDGRQRQGTVRADGDKLYNKGASSNGTKISEAWERVR